MRRYWKLFAHLTLLGVVLVGCSPRSPKSDDAGGPAVTVKATDDAANPELTAPMQELPSFASEINSLSEFRQFADRPGGVIRSGEVIKFLIDNREYPAANPPVYYINSNFKDGGTEVVSWAALHREWALQAVPNFSYTLKQFSRTSYFTKSLKKRDFLAGRIQTFEADGEVFFGVWFVEMDLIKEEMLQFALQELKRSFHANELPLHYVQYSNHQTTKRIAPWLAQEGFVVHRLSDLLANVPFQSLNVGEAWGNLRFAPNDPNELLPSDIPVFEVLPLDLGVVAGTITTAFQDVASHVNIKAKQRDTPNLMLRDADALTSLKKLAGLPIHLTVTQDGYHFEASTKAIVDGKLAALMAKREWQTPPADLGGVPVSFDTMCVKGPASACLALSARFGGKASGLGFLAHRDVIGEGSPQQSKLGYRLTPLGFAVPIASYKSFVEFNSKRDPAFSERLQRLMRSERSETPLSSAKRRALISEIQASFLEASFPPKQYETFHKQLRALKKRYEARYPGQKLKRLKIRSSANVEDIPSFNGAGLHNSYSAKLSKSVVQEASNPCVLAEKEEESGVKISVSPKSAACAIKAAYASLWNLRAVSERSFRGFDHAGALMGLAVVPSYKHKSKSTQGKLKANSVLITRVLNAPTVYGYQLSTQVQGNLVTNPSPGTLSELTTLTFQLRSVPAATVLQYAQPVASEPRREQTLLSNKRMREIVAIARAVEEAYCKANPSYFWVDGHSRKCHQVSNSQAKPTALDMELKIYSNGEILFKQVREFDGR